MTVEDVRVTGNEGSFGIAISNAGTVVLNAGAGVCRDRADEGEPDLLLEAGQIEPGDADGDREGGSA